MAVIVFLGRGFLSSLLHMQDIRLEWMCGKCNLCGLACVPKVNNATADKITVVEEQSIGESTVFKDIA